MKEGFEKTILVADDEEDIRDIVKYHLEKEGYNVIISENGEEAIDVLRSHDISLTITDLKMPKVDGFGVLDYIERNKNFIPAIVLTGYVDVELVVKAMKKGCFDYIAKPIKKDKFMDVVRKALDKKENITKLNPFEFVGVYLLDSSGVVIFHNNIAFPSEFDADIFGSMFTAVKAFIRDSFHSDGELKIIEHGSFKFLVEEGEDFFLVVIGKGDITEPVRENMKNIVCIINAKYGETISNWKGDKEVFEGIEKEFEVITNVFECKIFDSKP